MDDGFEIRPRSSRLHCPYCRGDVTSEKSTSCPSCQVEQHVSCAKELGRCSSCGASMRTRVEVKGKRRPYRPREWGRSNQSAGFLGLNQKGIVVFIILMLTCLPLCFIPFLVPSWKEDYTP